ncbi:probable cytochrome P450 6a14 [Schistocerca piceifrons]|uniref:probable cytochrome P450 6a14 n=1 Tax=Schistocerca piceifrons TaxID=274613 RepID=UPI001F5EBE51|nr:probable cytochrome P450 6a14 [Schistocerca piceifrons]
MIMVRDFNYFPDRGIYVDEETDHLSAHLFFLRGQKWRSLRQQLTPTFTSGKMRAMFGIVRDCARIMVDVIPSGRDVEVRELTSSLPAPWASTSTVSTIPRQWRWRFFQTSLRSYLTLSLGLANPYLRTLLPLPFTPKDITEYFTRVVDDTVKHREKTGIIRKDFMQLMIQLKNNGYVDDSFSITGKKGAEHGNKTLTTKEMAAQAWVFFLGGFETSSTTVSFCLYELSKRPDIQKKLQEEVDDVMRKTNGDVTYDDIMTKMPYMEKVVNGTTDGFDSFVHTSQS